MPCNDIKYLDRYIKIYKKYQDFLTGKADTETANFLQEPHGLSSFSKVSNSRELKTIMNFSDFLACNYNLYSSN